MPSTSGGRHVRFRQDEDDLVTILFPSHVGWYKVGIIHWDGRSWWVEYDDDDTINTVTNSQNTVIKRKVDRLSEEKSLVALKAMGPWTWKVKGYWYGAMNGAIASQAATQGNHELAGSGHGYATKTAAFEAARYVAARMTQEYHKPAYIEAYKDDVLEDCENC